MTIEKEQDSQRKGKKRKYWEYLFLGLFVAFFGIREFYQADHKYELSKNYTREYQDIATSEMIDFPPKGNFAVIVWSTTCPPCRLEMKRLKSSVEGGSIQTNQIFALNPYENKKTIKKFLKRNPFPFRFINIPGLVQQLEVLGTPTIAWFEGERLVYKKTGVSLTGVFRLEQFLR